MILSISSSRLQETHPEWVTLQKSMKLFYTPRWKYTETGLRNKNKRNYFRYFVMCKSWLEN